MADDKNFLLGYGERLTEDIQHVGGGGPKAHPYTFEEAKQKLVPKIQDVAATIAKLPALACPQDETVALITLHPTYIAKSYYPSELLQVAGLEAIGSRSREIVPEKWTRKQHPQGPVATTEIYVAGPRKAFHNFARSLETWKADTRGASDLIEIEDFRIQSNQERLKPILSADNEILLEVVLHASGHPDYNYVLEGFHDYLASLNVMADFHRRFHAEGLCFIPLRAPRAITGEIAKFSFLRVMREMPILRPLEPFLRAASSRTFSCNIPQEPPVDPEIRVAVFDAGMPDLPLLDHYVTRREGTDIGEPINDGTRHGMAVTSALLFGPLKEDQTLERPYAKVDHYRVIDANDNDDLYDVLERIRDVLQTHRYEFINLSIGPAYPIEDNDVHGWTAVLDNLLSGGETLASVAVGNTGEYDHGSGNARIQPPADCVNAIAIGASDTMGDDWKRASYSSIGPGRSPGVVKPDALAFGGCNSEPFYVLDADGSGRVTATCGTSFASPFALRTAIGIRSHFGDVLSPIALKALLINSCECIGNDRIECGWGRIPTRMEDIVICRKGSVRVVYQGKIQSNQWMRVRIPTPVEPITGKVKISATFCFVTTTDPQDSVSYTRSGLEVIFRPHEDKFSKESQANPNSKSFFKARDYYATEQELRTEAHKWETTLHHVMPMNGSYLKNPVFDIHYNARLGGGTTKNAGDIKYALVLTVATPSVVNLYDLVLNKYRTQLEPLQPVIQIPITNISSASNSLDGTR